jgi:8-oxo-dGTP pyrophosphatase MutT (NUDIX family)
MDMNVSDRDAAQQAGAIPWRWNGTRIEVLLITSSQASRWIVPKGWIDGGCTPQETARHESYEEAGVEGILSHSPIGSLDFKRGDRVLRVMLFTLEVTESYAHWPEDYRRQRVWLAPRDAALTASEPGLAHLIRVLEARLLEIHRNRHVSGSSLSLVV